MNVARSQKLNALRRELRQIASEIGSNCLSCAGVPTACVLIDGVPASESSRRAFEFWQARAFECTCGRGISNLGVRGGAAELSNLVVSVARYTTVATASDSVAYNERLERLAEIEARLRDEEAALEQADAARDEQHRENLSAGKLGRPYESISKREPGRRRYARREESGTSRTFRDPVAEIERAPLDE